MSNVVHFQRACVIIDGGTITASTDASEIGRTIFTVEMVSGDGSRCIVFDGPDHGAALEAASDLRLPIFDKTEGGRA